MSVKVVDIYIRGLVNIHHYSPPLRRVIVNCYQCLNFTLIWLFSFSKLFYPAFSFYRFILINSLCCDSLNGNWFEHGCKFVGVHFPANGPVMQKKTQGWETSTEKMTAYGGVLQGNVPMFLKLEGGGSHRCDFRTTYKYVDVDVVSVVKTTMTNL